VGGFGQFGVGLDHEDHELLMPRGFDNVAKPLHCQKILVDQEKEFPRRFFRHALRSVMAADLIDLNLTRLVREIHNNFH